MSTDTILICGEFDLQLPKLLEKLGYSVLIPGRHENLSTVLGKQVIDLVIIDGRVETLLPELADYLRSDELAKKIPLIAISGKSLPPDAKLQKVELLPPTVSPGVLASKIATTLRLRKMQGFEDQNVSLAEMNAALRDLSAHFKKELEEARKIQQGLLPKELPEGETHELSMLYQPLEDVGGDWCYANRISGGKILLQIADVTGHGLAAAFLGSMSRLALYAAGKENPAELLREMNRLLSPQLPAERFVTAASVLFDPLTGEVTYASAGHPPLLKRTREGATIVKAQGYAFGFFEDSTYTEVTFNLAPGESLLLFTDGISEAQNRSMETFGIDKVCAAFGAGAPEASADQMRDEIVSQFEKFRDGRLLKDDITLLILKRRK